MKTSFPFSLSLIAVACFATTALADSKRTAEYVLSNPTPLENKEVTLDVAFVKPVHWKSPIPQLAFFHVMTIDRNDRKPGGGILVAIPAEEVEKFVKKYGMDFDGRSNFDSLKGTLIAAHGRGPKGQIWLVDVAGNTLELLKEHKAQIVDDGDGGGNGPKPGPGPKGSRRGGPPQ